MLEHQNQIKLENEKSLAVVRCFHCHLIDTERFALIVIGTQRT